MFNYSLSLPHRNSLHLLYIQPVYVQACRPHSASLWILAYIGWLVLVGFSWLYVLYNTALQPEPRWAVRSKVKILKIVSHRSDRSWSSSGWIVEKFYRDNISLYDDWAASLPC